MERFSHSGVWVSWNSRNLQNHCFGSGLWVRPCWVAVLDGGIGWSGSQHLSWSRSIMSVSMVTLIPFLARPMSSRRWPEIVKKTALPAPAERDSQTYNDPIPYSLYSSSLMGIKVDISTSSSVNPPYHSVK